MSEPSLNRSDLARYGLMGLPLAFLALPLYVLLPNHYAREFGMSLATLGGALLATRLLDALVDPLIGRYWDQLFRRSHARVLRVSALLCVLMLLGFAGLFFPMTSAPQALLGWSVVLLLLTYVCYSAVTLAHQSWGALLGGDALQQGRLVAWREGLGLLGVLLASVVPVIFGIDWMVLLFGVSLLFGYLSWRSSPPPGLVLSTAPSVVRLGWQQLVSPWRRQAFRRLLAVFMLNGIASAVPATLLLFFVQDRLQVEPAMQSAFLGTYFLCAALSLPLWLRSLRRFGLAPSWLAGMLLAVLVFLATILLQAGDGLAFVVICAFSGLALGADLALPAALLALQIRQAGDLGQTQGAYFGWWNGATKLNLALAAGLALPLLEWAGYLPGTREPQALQVLTLAYCLLPCLLKLCAAALLYLFFIRQPGDARSV